MLFSSLAVKVILDSSNNLQYLFLFFILWNIYIKLMFFLQSFKKNHWNHLWWFCGIVNFIFDFLNRYKTIQFFFFPCVSFGFPKSVFSNFWCRSFKCFIITFLLFLGFIMIFFLILDISAFSLFLVSLDSLLVFKEPSLGFLFFIVFVSHFILSAFVFIISFLELPWHFLKCIYYIRKCILYVFILDNLLKFWSCYILLNIRFIKEEIKRNSKIV